MRPSRHEKIGQADLALVECFAGGGQHALRSRHRFFLERGQASLEKIAPTHELIEIRGSRMKGGRAGVIELIGACQRLGGVVLPVIEEGQGEKEPERETILLIARDDQIVVRVADMHRGIGDGPATGEHRVLARGIAFEVERLNVGAAFQDIVRVADAFG